MVHLAYHRQRLGEQGLRRTHEASLREGGIAALPIHVDSFDDDALLLAEVSESGGTFRLCRSLADIDGDDAGNGIGLLLAPSYAAIGDRPERLLCLKELGAVMFPMSLNARNLLADGCGEREASGLSDLGVQVVKTLNRLGILVDVSHLSERSFWHSLEASSAPVIASHSNSRALCDNPRNLSDEQVKAIAEKGGAVGATWGFVHSFHARNNHAGRADVQRLHDELRPVRRHAPQHADPRRIRSPDHRTRRIGAIGPMLQI